MSFANVEKVKRVGNNNNRVLKLVDLYGGTGLHGVYARKEKGEFSNIYVFGYEDENGEVSEVKLYGSISLDEYMDDSLIGRYLHITCIETKYSKQGKPYGVADVKVWQE
jgi:hypothetical protein